MILYLAFGRAPAAISTLPDDVERIQPDICVDTFVFEFVGLGCIGDTVVHGFAELIQLPTRNVAELEGVEDATEHCGGE